MAIYTKRGDQGQTSLYDVKNAQDKRVSKNSMIINAIGSVDEVNSFLGIVASQIDSADFKDKIYEIQRNLFTVGSILAGAKLQLQRDKVTKLEKEIDEMEGTLPVLMGFILPGGSKLSSHLHYVRSLVRRAERSLVALPESSVVRLPLTDILVYINRLSDYFFMLARKVNFDAKVEEKKWKNSTFKG